MSELIGKLDTPSSKGAYIEVKEDDTIYFDGYTNRLNFNTHHILTTPQPYKGIQIRSNSDIPTIKHHGSELMLFSEDSEKNANNIILRTFRDYDKSDYSDLMCKPNRGIYWDNYLLSQLFMPSNNYIDLELGASGTSYTMPANGYIVIEKRVGENPSKINEYFRIDINKIFYQERCGINEYELLSIYLPVKKNDVVNVDYNATGATETFRFIYSVLDSIITE